MVVFLIVNPDMLIFLAWFNVVLVASLEYVPGVLVSFTVVNDAKVPADIIIVLSGPAPRIVANGGRLIGAVMVYSPASKISSTLA